MAHGSHRHGSRPYREAPPAGAVKVPEVTAYFWVVKLLTTDRPVLGGISVRRPTLDDVFLSLTGRQIRGEGAEGQFARLRAIARRRG